MIKRFANNRASAAGQRERIIEAQRIAQEKATAAPVFADVRDLRGPATKGLVWMPRTDGVHPSHI